MAVLPTPIVSIDRALRWPAIECTEGGRGHIAREGPAARAPVPRVSDAVRNAARTRHRSRRTERAYVAWGRRSVVIVCLVGDAMKDVLKTAGIKAGTGLTKSILSKMPGKVLIEINKRVGFRLITKAGEKGAINLIKGVPVIGGVVGGAFDAAACRIAGKNAKRIFYARGTTAL